jgi:MFS family permease
MLRQWFVVCECTLVFGTLMLRVLVDVLMPLAMYTTPTWVLGLVFLGEAIGSVSAPFLLDIALVRWPSMSTRCVQLLAVALLCVAAPLALLAHLSVPGATIALFCTGAGHSVTEALVYAHLVEYVGCEEDISVLNAVMSALSLFTVLGCTVGPFIAAAPSHGSPQQQVLTVAAVSAAMLVYTTSYHWLLHKGVVPSQPSRPLTSDDGVEVSCDVPPDTNQA